MESNDGIVIVDSIPSMKGLQPFFVIIFPFNKIKLSN